MNHVIDRRFGQTFAVLILSTALSSQSVAQIEEIIVTAQKREESLQDVPISIQAVTADDLENANINTVEELVAVSPTLTFSSGTNTSNSGIRVRGVGSSNFGISSESSVAVVIDGVVMSRGGAGLNELPGIERIEILNGPQGTLFGKNASAGLVHIVTKRPDLDGAGGSIDLKAAQDEEYKISASLNLPLSDSFGIRADAYHRTFDGIVENIVLNENQRGTENSGIRVKALWQPTDTLELLLSADYTTQNTEGRPFVIAGDLLGTSVGGTGMTYSEVTGITTDRNNVQSATSFQEFDDNDGVGFSAEINFDIGEHTLTSISAYRSWERLRNRDNDLLPVDGTIFNLSDRESEWFTQELRLTSPLNDGYDYVLGLYYFDARTDNLGNDLRFANNLFQSVRGTPRRDRQQTEVIDNLNYAAFGQVNFRPSERTTLLAGFRYLYDEVDVVSQSEFSPFLNAVGPPVDEFAGLPTAQRDETDFIYKLGVLYDVSDSAMAYLTYSTGFKGPAVTGDPGTQTAIAPETSRAIEAGFRSEFLDGRAQLNITAYQVIFEGFQQTTGQQDPADPSNIIFVLASRDDVDTQGVEVFLDVLLTDQLRLSGGIAYSKAEYVDTLVECSENNDPTNCPTSEIKNIDGLRLPNAPMYKGNVSLRYDFELGNQNAFVLSNVRAQTVVNYSATLDPLARQSGYGIVDFTAGMTFADDRYALKVFAKNIFDRHYLASTGETANQRGYIFAHLPRDFDRYYGASFSAYFGD